jgi:hypothetical protein
MLSGLFTSTFLALCVTSTANKPKIVERANLQTVTVLVARGVIAINWGIKRVPRLPAEVPTSRMTRRFQAVLYLSL